MRRLGRTEIEITPIGLGCWQFSQGKGFAGVVWKAIDQPTTDAVVSQALKSGVSWFDTAEAYGNGRSEISLSTALRNNNVKPGSVVVATKWLPILRTAANLAKTIDTRLSCLQGYPIDLYQVHIPWSFSSVEAQMRSMAGLIRAGRIRTVGVSNFGVRQMTRASDALSAEGTVLASNQVRISLLDRSIERSGLLDAARRLGVTLIAYSPLAQGVLTGKFHQNRDLVRSLPPGRGSWWSPAGRMLSAKGLARTAPLIEELRKIAAAYSVTVSQVALAWLVNFYGDTVVAIPGASRPAQAAENAGAMRLRLTEKEMRALDELSATVAKR